MKTVYYIKELGSNLYYWKDAITQGFDKIEHAKSFSSIDEAIEEILNPTFEVVFNSEILTIVEAYILE